MKILVTGNMGYVGSAVIKQLRVSFPQATLIGLDMGYFAHCLSSLSILPECAIDIQYIGDTRTIDRNILKGIDAIVHLAAISNDPMGNAFQDVTREINYTASVNLAKDAKRCGVKSFVFASSCSVYGFAETDRVDESSPVNPLTVYSKSKVLTERALAKMADSAFAITCLRFATACGVSDRLRLDLVLNDFIASAMACKKISILSDGKPWRPLIDVKDMARAIAWAIGRKQSKDGEILIVNAGGNSCNYQVLDIAQAVADTIQGVSISINKKAMPDKRSYRVNFDLFNTLATNYLPQVDLKTSTLEIKTRLEGLDFKDVSFRKSKYIRLSVLSDMCEAGMLSHKLKWIM